MKIFYSFPSLTTQLLLLDASQPQSMKAWHPLVSGWQGAATGLGMPDLIQESMYKYVFYCAIDFTDKSYLMDLSHMAEA